MLFLFEPTADTIARFLEEQRSLAFSYPEVGSTAGPAPAGYVADHSRISLGRGAATFKAGCRALAAWSQFKLGWVSPRPDNVPLLVGECISILARLGPVWWLNACRVVYLVDDDTAEMRRHGFAYGTLPDHAEQGEERFLIEWDRRDDQVWFDILAYSRPRHVLAKIGYPLVRRLQKRFGREATASLKYFAERYVDGAQEVAGG